MDIVAQRVERPWHLMMWWVEDQGWEKYKVLLIQQKNSLLIVHIWTCLVIRVFSCSRNVKMLYTMCGIGQNLQSWLFCAISSIYPGFGMKYWWWTFINSQSWDVQDLRSWEGTAFAFASQECDQSESGVVSASPRRKWRDNWCCVVTECQITFEEVFDHGLSFESTFNEFVLEVSAVIRANAELCEPTDMRARRYEITTRVLLLLRWIIVGGMVE